MVNLRRRKIESEEGRHPWTNASPSYHTLRYLLLIKDSLTSLYIQITNVFIKTEIASLKSENAALHKKIGEMVVIMREAALAQEDEELSAVVNKYVSSIVIIIKSSNLSIHFMYSLFLL